MRNAFSCGRLSLFFEFAIVSVICFLLITSGVALAEVRTIEADGYYLMGDGPDESQFVAKGRARMEAKRVAAEMAGVFVESLSEVKNGRITQDEVHTIASQVLKIQSENITRKDLGEGTRYCCHIVALVDTSDAIAKLRQDRTALYEAMKKNKQQEQELAAVKEELATLKAKYRTSGEDEKKKINQEFKNNENKFLAAEWVEKGREFALNLDEKKATECYNKALEIDPKYAPAYCGLGNLYDILSSYWKYDLMDGKRKAMKFFKKAIEVDPNYAPAWEGLGRGYHFKDDNKKAVKAYLKAIELNPRNAENWAGLAGIYYWDYHDYKNAADAFNKAIELYNSGPEKTYIEESREAEAYRQLSEIYKKLGEYEKAAEAHAKDLEWIWGKKSKKTSATR